MRDIAWSLRTLAKIDAPDPTDDVAIEASDSEKFASWPETDPIEWCGDWRSKPAYPQDEERHEG